jgi:Fe-S-cluster-containing dehydrogenase component/formate-dependent nitrite reductase membrane component NrfD
MNYGFVIDNSKCIGCHACSTACKSENEVPLGVNRTWVKYVETGVFPNSQRHFQVTRCNHCANPPCVRICPVTAMYQRDDGIVEFDGSICIGCKACMQACPYDAIYMDPDTNTAAKCHFCSHRLDLELEPACVVVCPTHAIIAGDMDNINSEISTVLALNNVTVRKPEQGTAPKLFYIEGGSANLVPTAAERTPETFMWADSIPLHPSHGNGHSSSNGVTSTASPRQSSSGEVLRQPQPQGRPQAGPIQHGMRVSEHMVQVAYNAQHKIPWHWPVPAYLVTKGIGTGLFMFFGLGVALNLFRFDPANFLVFGFLSLLFIGITTALLVLDLDKPEKFLSIVLRPQWKSWLARGAYLLISFTIIVGVWWLIELSAYLQLGWFGVEVLNISRAAGLWLGLPLSVGVAVYTAFLFGQAEGRDLWQSPLLPIHLLVQALMAGSGLIFVAGLVMQLSDPVFQIAKVTLISSVIIDILVTLLGEFGMPHASIEAASAAHEISHGRYKKHFWWGSLILGHLVPIALWFTVNPILLAIAGVCIIAGLYLFEYAFVMAPQEVPNS